VQLGDVLFIRQDSRTHRRIAGLLAGLATPARRVMIDDPASHAAIRKALDQPVTVEFKATPLRSALEWLAEKSKIDIRLDRLSIRSTKITDRTPITFELRDQSLRTTLDLLLAQMKFSWVVQDGVIWVTTTEQAESMLQTAVFDVRDLCPDDESSLALSNAIQRQAESKGWVDDGGVGSIEFAKPGVMVVAQTERALDSVQDLLENYRVALRNSKRRVSPDEDPEVVELKYYRLPTEVAEDLEKLLPALLSPETWKSEKQPNAVGTIRRVRSWSKIEMEKLDASGRNARLIPYSVLLIEQKRKVHQRIPAILQKVENGDGHPNLGGGMGGGGMGGGMGGMGGGVF